MSSFYCVDTYVCLLENWNFVCAKIYEFWSKVRFWKAPKLKHTTPLPPLWGYLLYHHSPLAPKLIKLTCTSNLQQHDHWTKIGNTIVFTPLIEIEINPFFLINFQMCVCEQNMVHTFSHVPSTWIIPIISRVVWDLDKNKQLSHVFIIYNQMSLL
jgi:hypothetical protein